MEKIIIVPVVSTAELSIASRQSPNHSIQTFPGCLLRSTITAATQLPPDCSRAVAKFKKRGSQNDDGDEEDADGNTYISIYLYTDIHSPLCELNAPI